MATGGAGYVGSHCVRWLERAGHEVWIYDNLSRGHRQFARAERLIEGDLSDQQRLRQSLEQQQIDVVI
ncbi:MAG: NAD-dependent epimerase/dehydratase family protein, partial [Planctomycetota bacterium]